MRTIFTALAVGGVIFLAGIFFWILSIIVATWLESNK